MKSTSSWAESDLRTRPYSTSPFERDFSFHSYQDRLSDSGETIRWWKGYERAGLNHDNGTESTGAQRPLYLEQNFPEKVRVLFSQTQELHSSPTFALWEAGTPTITYLPQEMELAQGDIIVRTSHPILSRCLLEPTGRTRDALPHSFIASIEKVFNESGVWSTAMYAVHEQGIEWREEAPSTAVLIEYRYHCTFAFQGPLDCLDAREGHLTSRYAEANYPRIGALRLLAPGQDVLE